MSDPLAAQLHTRGLRLTPQRRQVLDAVRALGHATPEQVADRVHADGGSLNLTTVYRALDLLESLGLVRHTHIGHGAPTYHPGEHYDHVHVRCNECGEVESHPTSLLESVAATLAEQHGFRLDASHVALAGLCSTCAPKKENTHDHTR